MALLCSNKKEDGSWCGVPIEWREIGKKPDGSPKKRPFEIDTGVEHNCPYWKKTFNKPAQTKSPTNAEGIIKEQVEQGVKIQSLEQDVKTLKIQFNDISKALAQISNFRASQLKQED